MHATMRQGFNRWNIPSSGDRLALEPFGRECGVQIQAWLEGEVEMIVLARVGEGEPEILYRGPLAALGGLTAGPTLADEDRPAQLVCPHCTYTWEPRVPNPAKCPECGYRLRLKRKGPGRVYRPAAQEGAR
jgi:ssDNA-binding Zn-finger/Zn-ribbon topoisomerase 1